MGAPMPRGLWILPFLVFAVASRADPEADRGNAMAARDIRTSHAASAAIFGGQRQERELLEALELDAVEERLRSLSSDLRRAERENLAPRGTEGTSDPGAQTRRAKKAESDARIRSRVDAIREQRTRIESRVEFVRSSRIRAIAQRTARKLEEIEVDTLALLDNSGGPEAGEQLRRLIDRLQVHESDFRAPKDRSVAQPTFTKSPDRGDRVRVLDGIGQGRSR